MAAPTAVVLPASRNAEFPPTTKRKTIEAQLTVDGTVGALPGDIPASLFGLSFIETCDGSITKSDNLKIVVISPSYDGTSVLGRLNVGTADGVANIPAGTYFIVMEGY